MKLALEECYRKIKPVKLDAVLEILPRLQFISVNQHNNKYPCDVVLKPFPKVINTLISELDLGGELARALLRRLSPRQSIPPHIDDWMPNEVNWRRFQVPLISHPDIIMRWPDDNIQVHLEPGWLYEVRYDRTHEVIHNTDCYRIHLQIDQVNATI